MAGDALDSLRGQIAMLAAASAAAPARQALQAYDRSRTRQPIQAMFRFDPDSNALTFNLVNASNAQTPGAAAANAYNTTARNTS